MSHQREAEIYCECGWSRRENEACDICAQIQAAYERGLAEAYRVLQDQLTTTYKRGRNDAAEAAYEWLKDDTRHTDQSLIDACAGES